MADYDVDKALGRVKDLPLSELMRTVEQVLETKKLQDRIERLEEENDVLEGQIKGSQLASKVNKDENKALRESLKKAREKTNRLQNQLEQAKMTNGENADYVARKVEVADELAKRNAELRAQLEHKNKAYKELYGMYIEARDTLGEVRRAVETDEED